MCSTTERCTVEPRATITPFFSEEIGHESTKNLQKVSQSTKFAPDEGRRTPETYRNLSSGGGVCVAGGVGEEGQRFGFDGASRSYGAGSRRHVEANSRRRSPALSAGRGIYFFRARYT